MSIDDPETPKRVSDEDTAADAEVTSQDEPNGDAASAEAAAVDEVSVDEVTVDEAAADDASAEDADEHVADESLGDDADVGDEPSDDLAVEMASVDEATEAPAAVEELPADAPSIVETLVEELPEEAPRLAADQLQAIVEALVFASPEPLTLKTLMKLLSDEPKEDVAAAVEALTKQYDRPGGLHFVEVAGGYQITTRPDCHEWVRRLFHERTTQKLSVQALETLAVIAYKQPITTAEIGEIRGVNTSGVLSTLLERHLVKIVGRKNVIGRPFLYATTREFLIRFGLKDLGDLPRVEDMAQALGFDAPAILRERNVSDEMLPLEETEQSEPS